MGLGNELTVAHDPPGDREPVVGQSCSKRSIANQFKMKWHNKGRPGQQQQDLGLQ